MIDNVQDELKKVAEEIDNDLLLGELKEYIDGLLSGYYAAEPLRIMEKKDYGNAVRLIDAIFEQYILRLNPEFIDSYEEYEFQMQKDFREVTYLLDSLVGFLVKRSLSKQAMVDAIYANISCRGICVGIFADLADRSFDRIQMKLIVDKLYEN